MVYINQNESTFDVKTVILTTSGLVIIFLFGLYLQIKIIIISKHDEDMTWKIDITHSIVMIIYYAFIISIETTTHVIPNLSHFTGSWFCYFTLYLKLYGLISITVHSLYVSIHKYIFIVYQDKVNNFGKEKARQISFWIYILHPAVFAITWMVRPHYRAIASINRCHGLQLQEAAKVANETIGGMAQRLFFCGLGNYDGYNSFDYFIYLSNQFYCFLQTVVILIVAGNIIEIFIYKKIFHWMKR